MKPSVPCPSELKFFGALVLVILSGCAVNPAGGSPQSSQTGIVKKADLIQKITVSGVIIPKRRTVILPPYNGYIKKMYVKIGDRVSSGDPVVSVVPSLNGQSGEIYPLRAPFSGQVVQVLHSDGEYVEATGDNNVLVRIDDLSGLFISVDIPELDIPKTKIGQEVTVKANPIFTKSYHGVIRELSLAAREKKSDWNRTQDKIDFNGRIEITDKDDQIRSGMSALVDIIANHHEGVLTLRHEFIQKKGDDYFVTLEDGTSQKIQVGLQNEEAFEILSGVHEGQKVRQTDFLSLSQEP